MSNIRGYTFAYQSSLFYSILRITHFLTVADVKRSAELYLRIRGGKIVREGEPTIIEIANSWIILNVCGGPTDDKPTVTLRTPQNPNKASNFMNIRVANIRSGVSKEFCLGHPYWA